jgi:hypothetical protein
LKCGHAHIYPKVANVGGLQSQGVEGEVVVLYFEPLTTQNLKSSGVPDGLLSPGPKGQQHGKIDPILRIHNWGFQKMMLVIHYHV